MKNKKIILCVGIPASGKTTWTLKYLKSNLDWICVSRDKYRNMLQNRQMLDYKGEQLVTKLVENTIVSSINSKYNVIIDQTNVNIKYLEPLVDFCQKLADVEFKIFNISIEKAIERDKNREAFVGEKVIKRMYNDYLNLFNCNFDFSTRKKLPYIAKNIKWKVNSNLPNAVIFDIDGTLGHMQGKRGVFDWNRVDVDTVDERVRETLKTYKKAGFHIIIVTGRDGVSKNLTAQWLRDNKIEFNILHTKPENDFRKDYINKTEIYNNHIKDYYNVLCVYEDRKQAVTTWRELGLKCYQVDDGDF